ncbi:MAG: NAD(P)H-quinone oxidoreductase [Pedobacter sp.]|uniref:NAD(P)H-quinone oxidoreductase n=1 Tax=Pedobacter sp. TaxID=1411316 RepID=UPI0033912680
MNAITITAPGTADVLKLQQLPTPELAADEILINVKAAGLNRADVAQRQGNYPAPAGAPQDILGMEVAGIVENCGNAVTLWKKGDQVCALIAGGGYAEYVAVKEGQCLPVPSNFSFAEAASLPEAVFTVWSNVFERGRLVAGETLLIHGGNSGIGITAIQLGKLFNTKVLVTVGSEEKGRLCVNLGADGYVNYKTSDFEQLLKKEGVDVILDMIGGDYFEKNISILRPDGRLVYINSVAGNKVPLDISKLMLKRLTVTGSTLRSRDYAFKKNLTAAIREKVWPLMEAGKFKPVIYKTFPLDQAADAHRSLEEGSHTGKIVLLND